MENKNFELVLFGATGDLARKKIIPALFELYEKGLLPNGWKAVMFIRRDWSRGEFEDFLLESIGKSKNDAGGFLDSIKAFYGHLDDKASFEELKKSLEETSKKIFYFSISPSFYASVFGFCKDVELVADTDKILIEKPFGQSLEDAKNICNSLLGFVNEAQILLVDHYLAKDAVSEINSANMPPESSIAEIESKIIEKNTVGTRGAFYDNTGAFIDVGQNHMLQMIAITLSKIGNDKFEVLKGIKANDGEMIKAQYIGYKDEADVRPDSQTETYFKIHLKYKKINLILESGKGFDQSIADITIKSQDGSFQEFDFNKTITGALTPYAKIILASIDGNTDMFVSLEEALEQWRISEEIQAALQSAPLQMYDKGLKYKENLFQIK